MQTTTGIVPYFRYIYEFLIKIEDLWLQFQVPSFYAVAGYRVYDVNKVAMMLLNSAGR